ncbi:hypothetical protein NB311A_11262 [Nitrobacter sp. Nb-311A]|nr:hypothetical protein NB311A_11262 [Nitrobacter sp. Nb-311A]
MFAVRAVILGDEATRGIGLDLAATVVCGVEAARANKPSLPAAGAASAIAMPNAAAR